MHASETIVWHTENDVTRLVVSGILDARLNRYATDDHPDTRCHDTCTRDIANGVRVIDRVAGINIAIHGVVLVNINPELNLQVLDTGRDFLINDPQSRKFYLGEDFNL